MIHGYAVSTTIDTVYTYIYIYDIVICMLIIDDLLGIGASVICCHITILTQTVNAII